MRLQKIILLLLIVGTGSILNGQEDTLATIVGAARYQDGTLTLRWSVDQPAVFFALSRHGYQINRYDLDTDGIPQSSSKVTMDIMPISYTKVEAICEKNPDNPFIWTAANALYGSRNTNPAEGFDLFAKVIEQENLFTYAMISADMDVQAAQILGLRFTDTQIKEGKQYLYQIKPAPSYQKQELHIASILAEAKSDPLLQPEIAHIVEEEKQVTLQWSRADLGHQYSGFWIERSENGQKYERVNQQPYLGGQTDDFSSDLFAYTCSAENYKKYHYRVIGITPFAELSPPSEAYIAQARDRTPPPPVTKINPQYINEENVSITWDQINSKDLDHYELRYALKYNAPYRTVAIKKKGESTQHDFTVDASHHRHFFKILSVDTADNYSSSHIVTLTREDSIPPAPPTNLKGTVDTNGIVILSWDSNSEEDLKGYFVHFANSSKHFFSNITPLHLNDTSYTDTISLKTHTEEIFYRVVAIDYNNNYSDYSEILQLKRPNIIPPQPSVFHTKRVEDNGILLGWHNSKSKDFVKNKLYRKTGEDNWDLIGSFDAGTTEFIDTTVLSGKLYQYRIIAMDDANLESEVAFDYGIVNQRDDIIPAPLIESASYNEKEKKVILSFSSSSELRHRIYRADKKDQFVTLGYLQRGQTVYEDYRIRSGKEYAYRLMAIADDGRKSSLGKTSVVRVE